MSRFLRGLGTFIQIIGGLLGFALTLLFVYWEFGGGGVFIALFVFPLTFGIVPFYALVYYGSWSLLLINYGSLAAGWVLHWIAKRIEEQPVPSNVALVSADPPRKTPNQEAKPGLARPEAKGDSSSNALPWVLGILAVLFFFACIASSKSLQSTSPTHTSRPTLVVPTKTPTSRPTWTPRPVSVRACVTNETIRIRKGPGTNYETIDGMVSGTCMSILGRNQEGDWVYMVSEDNKTGWVFAELLTIEGDLGKVSVITASDISSAPPTVAAILPTTSTRKSIIVPTNTSRPVVVQPTARNNNCSSAYPGVCIPPGPDLDCKDIPFRRFTVLPPDPHRFDMDGDGIGCE
jgi:uncharacterized protein YraI